MKIAWVSVATSGSGIVGLTCGHTFTFNNNVARTPKIGEQVECGKCEHSG